MDALNRKIANFESYMPPLTAPDDLNEYWENTLKEFAGKPLNAVREKADAGIRNIDAYKVSYEGFDSTRINGWFLLPGFMKRENLPCVVVFHGYQGGKGLPAHYSQWLLMGMAVFAIDIRGQGGETGNNMQNDFGMTRGWMTQGILDRDTCYYKAVTVDCLKAVDWVWEQPEVDRSRICVLGSSQGGGLTLITAALSGKLSLAVAGVPNMCHMDAAVSSSSGSISEASDFMNRFPDKRGQVMKTLRYYDIMNLAHRIKVPVLVSVGYKDPICPPDTVYAAYNRIEAPKSIEAYPFGGHAQPEHFSRRIIEFISEKFAL